MILTSASSTKIIVVTRSKVKKYFIYSLSGSFKGVSNASKADEPIIKILMKVSKTQCWLSFEQNFLNLLSSVNRPRDIF